MTAGIARARRLSTVDDARRAARRRVPLPVFDVVDGAAEGEVTAARNRSAFDDVTWMHRAARAVGEPRLGTRILGTSASLPMVLAPCGLVGSIHPSAEPAAFRAAARAGVPAVSSTCATASLERIAREGGAGDKWFQLYFLGGRKGARALVDRAADAGYRTLVVTVDTPVSGHRERDSRHGVSLPMTYGVRNVARIAPHVAVRPGWLWRLARDRRAIQMGNLAHGERSGLGSLFEEPPTWSDLDWIRRRWNGPLVVKGLMSADDARTAVDCGADAVVVSNHGGRQLDGLPATLDVLPAVVSAVGDRAEVYVDGGIRRGSDVAKALALGARAVLIGRAYLYGLAAAGEPGVDRVLTILADELRRALVLLGCEGVDELGPHVLGSGTPVRSGRC